MRCTSFVELVFTRGTDAVVDVNNVIVSKMTLTSGLAVSALDVTGNASMYMCGMAASAAVAPKRGMFGQMSGRMRRSLAPTTTHSRVDCRWCVRDVGWS